MYASVCVYAHTYVCTYVLEGEPALLAFTSTAIEHLCLALLLVATVTKAQSGVAAAAKERARDRGKDRERERKIFACGPNHNDRFNATHQKTQFR